MSNPPLPGKKRLLRASKIQLNARNIADRQTLLGRLIDAAIA